MLADWKAGFNETFPGYPGGRNEEVGLALCLLLCTTILPAIDRTEPDSVLEGLLMSYEGELMRLLEKAVGDRGSELRGRFEEMACGRERLAKQLACVHRLVDETISDLYTRANGTNQRLAASYTELRGRLVTLNEDQLLAIGQIQVNLDAQAEQADRYLHELARINAELQRLDQRIVTLTNTTLILMEEI